MSEDKILKIKEEDGRVLIQAIQGGNAALFLGAGASATSLSHNGTPIMQGWELARALADMAGFDYHDEPLPNVVGAVVGRRVSRVQFEQKLNEEFTRCEPSLELQGLMSFSWRRLYTWNLDDTITNCRSTAQRLKVFNGLADPVTPNDNLLYLQVVHLHGEAWKPEHGYIFSEAEYNQAITRGHPWYSQATADYAERVPIFIGSKLKEPILSLELDRARPNGNEGLGIAFLVTPDKFTPLQLEEFEARGISVISGCLSDFIRFIQKEISAEGLKPEEIISASNEAGKELVQRGRVTPEDLTVAQHLKVIKSSDGKDHITVIPDDTINLVARNYLEGMPPSWAAVRAKIPVELHQLNVLTDQLKEAYASTERLFVVYGQSGSGKTTATMQAILRLSADNPGIPVYELDGNVPSLRSAINLLSRLHPGEKILVYFGESFIFGDSLSEDLLSKDAEKMLFLGDARTGEWKTHISRRLQEVEHASFEFQRFGIEDYDALSKAILKYVPAPKFHKMTIQERREEFQKSKSQLLIAMKEVTQARKFRDIITKEYEGLPDDDSRLCFLVCGVATLARAGVSRGLAKESYERIAGETPFNVALSSLEGIVSEDRNGRLIARHEVYVRHVLENVASTNILQATFVSLLRSFTKFDVPVIKSVGRQDGLLFRFLLNHNVLREMFRAKSAQHIVRDIYSSFEIDFQRDGHFWLQYGQFLSSVGEYEDALPILEKSIQAYPENDYAAHALADMQLRVAGTSSNWDGAVMELVNHAVSTLEQLHADRASLSDQYPIVTLAERYVPVLVRHGQMEEARAAAKRYFEEIGQLKQTNEKLEATRTELLHFLTSGKLTHDERSEKGQPSSNKRMRGRYGKKQRRPKKN